MRSKLFAQLPKTRGGRGNEALKLRFELVAKVRASLLRLLPVLCALVLTTAQAQRQEDYQIGLSLVDRQIVLYGPQNTCYGLELSNDMTRWSTLAILNPTIWPSEISLMVTQTSAFFRSVILSSWSIGGFDAVLDLQDDFGAVGDGITDDTAAVQAALDSARTFSNAVVFAPPGIYRITQTCALEITDDSAEISPRLILVGKEDSILFWDGNNQGPILAFAGCLPQLAGIRLQTDIPQVTGIVYTPAQ